MNRTAKTDGLPFSFLGETFNADIRRIPISDAAFAFAEALDRFISQGGVPQRGKDACCRLGPNEDSAEARLMFRDAVESLQTATSELDITPLVARSESCELLELKRDALITSATKDSRLRVHVSALVLNGLALLGALQSKPVLLRTSSLFDIKNRQVADEPRAIFASATGVPVDLYPADGLGAFRRRLCSCLDALLRCHEAVAEDATLAEPPSILDRVTAIRDKKAQRLARAQEEEACIRQALDYQQRLKSEELQRRSAEVDGLYARLEAQLRALPDAERDHVAITVSGDSTNRTSRITLHAPGRRKRTLIVTGAATVLEDGSISGGFTLVQGETRGRQSAFKSVSRLQDSISNIVARYLASI